jgi:riboflavin kinase / FMN adenylyltransferase
MMVIRDGDEVPQGARGGVFAIGNFDGVHRGHKALISRAVAEARDKGRPAGVIVFEPHPREFFHPEEPHFRLTPLTEKLRLLEALGLDLVVVLEFNREFASRTATGFIEDILVCWLGVSHVVIGYDFFFGRKRAGTPETMQLAGQDAGFGTTVVAQQAEEGEVFSSTAIRLHLAQGDVAGAALQLGHWWRVAGVVTSGQQLGRELGFPTANIELPTATALMHGIYAARVLIGGEWYGGATYLGGRPSVDAGPVRLEVFILDFDGDLYEKDIAIEFIAFVRGDRRFDSLEALKEQMVLDVEKARQLLTVAGDAPPHSAGIS